MALLLTFAGSFARPAHARQTGGASGQFVAVLEDSFILYQNEHGETVCRVASPAERDRIQGDGETHVIYRGAPLRREASDGGEVLVPNGPSDTTGLPLLPSAGLTIVLEGTQQLESNPAAKAAFIIAANRWESIISTPITLTLKVDYGTTFFGEAYPSPNILGQAGSFIIKDVNGNDPSLSIVRQRLVESGTTPSELELYNALPSSSLPVE